MVVVGFLILAGAVNTAIVGSNAVVSRVSEDGVLPDWFRQPHRRYGTSYRVLNTVVALQLLTVLLSRGDMYLLGEAYAFGVVWSFSLMGLAVLVLRFTGPDPARMARAAQRAGRRRGVAVGLAIISLAACSRSR